MLTNERRATLQKRGVLWKIRTTEKEIAVAEDKGCLVKTYSCDRNILNQIAKKQIVEGAFITFEFNTKRRVVVGISYIVMRNHVSKWNNHHRYAFAQATTAPLLNLHKNGRLTECKFVEDPQERESSAYISTSDLDFKLKNMQYISFSLNVNIQNTRNLRNRPYLDLVATNVKQAKETEDTPSELRGNSSAAVNQDDGISSWLSRRMTSPRRTSSSRKSAASTSASRSPAAVSTTASRSPDKVNTNASRLPTKVNKRSQSRDRNDSASMKSEILDKRDPCSKYSGPAAGTVSAPVTPLVTPQTEDLPENYNDFCATFKSNKNPQGRCLRCDDGEICTHKPPRKNNNNIIQEPVSVISENNSDETIGKLSNQVDFLKRQLEEMRSQMMEAKKTAKIPASLSPIQAQRNISYTFNDFSIAGSPSSMPDFCENYYDNYDQVFKMSPSGSTDLSYEPEPYYEAGFACAETPSYTRSDMLSNRNAGKSSYFVNKTPLIDSMYSPGKANALEKHSMSDNQSVSSASSHSNGYVGHDSASDSIWTDSSDSYDGLYNPTFLHKPVGYGRAFANEDRHLMRSERDQFNTYSYGPRVTSLSLLEEAAFTSSSRRYFPLE